MEPLELQKISLAIEGTLHGNPDAYTVIVTAYMQRLYRTALILCGNATVAEDLVQETFIDGYLHLYELRDPEKIEGWLSRILRNKTVNALARTRKTEPYDTLERRADKRTPESLFVAKETMTELHARFDALSPTVRETAVLYFLEGLSMAEIANATGAPLGTVKRRIHDARIKLRGDIRMTENKTTLPDSFAEALATKIRDLENYTKTYGTVGFDSAYENVKELIQNLSSSDDVKEYSVKSAKIASDVDTKYCEEALAVYRKFGDVKKASDLLMDMCDKFWRGIPPKTDITIPVTASSPSFPLIPKATKSTLSLAATISGWRTASALRGSRKTPRQQKSIFCLQRQNMKSAKVLRETIPPQPTVQFWQGSRLSTALSTITRKSAFLSRARDG